MIMNDVRRILFPVDPEGFSKKIVPEVIALAREYQAQVHLLMVVDTFEGYSTFYVPHPSLDTFEEELVKRAERRLEEFEEEYFSDWPDTVRVVMKGAVVEEIMQYVSSAGIDLIVMGNHGKKGLDLAIFGSVAEEVIRVSPVPVMSVNPYAGMEKMRWGGPLRQQPQHTVSLP